MAGVPVAIKDMHKKLQLYLQICPNMDLNYRCLPKAGGWYDQYYEDVTWFGVIEDRIKQIMVRKEQQEEAKNRKGRL